MVKLLLVVALCVCGDNGYERRLERAKTKILVVNFSDSLESIEEGRRFLAALTNGEILTLAKTVKKSNKQIIIHNHYGDGLFEWERRYSYRPYYSRGKYGNRRSYRRRGTYNRTLRYMHRRYLTPGYLYYWRF